MATGGTDFIALDAARSATEDDNLHRLGVPDTDGNTGPPGRPPGPVGRSSVRIAAATVRPSRWALRRAEVCCPHVVDNDVDESW